MPVGLFEERVDVSCCFRLSRLVGHSRRHRELEERRRPVRSRRATREHADVPILTNQVQYHPFWVQIRLLDYCQIHDIMPTAYSPLAYGGAVSDNLLEEIGARYGKTSAKIALRWLIQQDNVSTVPKSTNPAHLEANVQIFGFELTEGEIRAIARLSLSWTASSFFVRTAAALTVIRQGVRSHCN